MTDGAGGWKAALLIVTLFVLLVIGYLLFARRATTSRRSHIAGRAYPRVVERGAIVRCISHSSAASGVN